MSKENCARAHKLWLDRAEVTAIEESDLEWLAIHVRECEHCRKESRLLGMLELDDTSGPIPELDDLARQRAVEQFVSILGKEKQVLTERDGSMKRLVMGIGIGFAAMFLIVSVIGAALFAGGFFKETSPLPTKIASAEPEDFFWTLERSSGAVVLTNAGEIEAVRLKQGSRISVGEGSAVVDFEGIVSLHLGEESRASFERLDSDKLIVNIEAGHVFGEVDPEADGPTLVLVTPNGEVTVTGTVFSVNVKPEKTTVCVFRGNVRLPGPQKNARTLASGQAIALGEPSPRTITSQERMEYEMIREALSLTKASQTASLRIASIPSGATVSLDDVVQGLTPFTMTIRAGNHVVEVSMDGRETVRTTLEMVPGSMVFREFDLSEVPEGETVFEETSAAPVAKRATGPLPAGPDPEELLAQAQSFRQARNWEQAIVTYRELIRLHPGSRQARAACVSMGNIQLDYLHQPSAALRSFERYLKNAKPRGVLVQEASFSRVLCLRALGRRELERRALIDFIRDFPNGIQTPRARERLGQL